MTNRDIIKRESGVFTILQEDYCVPEADLCTIIDTYGSEIREATVLGFHARAIANEYFHRWATR